MSAPEFDLPIEAGATFNMAMTLRTGTAPDAPAFNLTGWEPRLQVRERAEALGVELDCRPSNGRLVVADAAAGQIALAIAADETARMDDEELVYDLIIVHASGTVRRLLAGKVTVSPAVTR